MSLLPQMNTLLSSVTGEITRLKAKKAYVLGGTGAVSSGVEAALKAKLGNASVIRIAGANRRQ
jgi:putative cell wall-binding protein